jgi:hypothetical protein
LFEVAGDIEKLNGGLEPAPEPACVLLSPGHIVATATWITVVGNIYDGSDTGSPPSVLLFNGATTGTEDAKLVLVLVLARAADMETMYMDMGMVFIVCEVEVAETSTASFVDEDGPFRNIDRPSDSVVSTGAFAFGSGPC